MSSITTCALFYGNYPALATRCLESLCQASVAAPEGVLRDFNFGMNECSVSTAQVVDECAAKLAAKLPPNSVRIYRPKRNVYKYPLMRRMLYDLAYPPAEFVMWLDDDSYLERPDQRWWDDLLPVLDGADMLGERWYHLISENQWRWCADQPWFNSEAPRKPQAGAARQVIPFFQGGWWIARTAKLRQLNWPWPELRHCGGDSLLGLAMSHIGARMVPWSLAVCPNCDRNGLHSKARRRGYSEHVLAASYDGKPLDTSHQQFECAVTAVVGT